MRTLELSATTSAMLSHSGPNGIGSGRVAAAGWHAESTNTAVGSNVAVLSSENVLHIKGMGNGIPGWIAGLHARKNASKQ